MVVQKFYDNLIKSGIFYFYVNVVFFTMVIFFAINDNLFTSEEVVLGTICATLVAKAVSNLMCAWGISHVDLQAYEDKLEGELKKKQADIALVDLRYKNKSAEALKKEKENKENEVKAA